MDATEYVLKYLIEQCPNDKKLKEYYELYIKDEDFDEDKEVNLQRYLEPDELINFEEHRHWNECTAIEKMGDKWVAYSWATTTGDLNATDKGWEFEPDFDFVEPYEEIITVRKWRVID